MRIHPEIGHILKYFLCRVLNEQPTDIASFAQCKLIYVRKRVVLGDPDLQDMVENFIKQN
ncbi:hypothetical protein ROZALSC1DRAFT_31863 [Rozella allomycis CSF55]|uniref:Uncharacterized protein n=1 Tax=Rozella allomycis (strain CSF55) TaxID=988480 RepID=A0A075AZD5_ROZAC|nr:hypothetical protein O9G_005102 [Rozella allomycis CSF55]RKP16016.1 hypothetical protein ROZALSC1DRAFT_31863 [Rozella allomycis CSF55]|eukprot:EPZ35582.1 hypothetical protein O9G_005102 [Rozella allomycis CSF55]